MRGLTVDLKGQTALVTGASRGIGRAVAERLVGCGANLAAVARSAEALAELVETARTAGVEAEAFPCDVADADAVRAVIEQVEARFKRVEILVNNAGITKDGLLLMMDDDAWDQVMATNLRSAFLFTRGVGKLMLRQRYGRIINMASVSALRGNPGQANYSASKAGLIGFTQTVAKELGKRPITVNAIAPGFIATDMTSALPEAVRAEAVKHIPMGRLGQADEIADLACYLASRGAGYLTGQVIAVDGGMSV